MRSRRIGLGLLLCFLLANASEAWATAEQIAEIKLERTETVSTPTEISEPETVSLRWQTLMTLKSKADAAERYRSELAKCRRQLRQHARHRHAKKRYTPKRYGRRIHRQVVSKRPVHRYRKHRVRIGKGYRRAHAGKVTIRPCPSKKRQYRTAKRPHHFIICPVCKANGKLYHYRPERYRMHLKWCRRVARPVIKRAYRVPVGAVRPVPTQTARQYLRSPQGRQLIREEARTYLRSPEGRELIRKEAQRLLATQKPAAPTPSRPAAKPTPKAAPPAANAPQPAPANKPAERLSDKDEEEITKPEPVITLARVIIFLLFLLATAGAMWFLLRSTRGENPAPMEIRAERITIAVISLVVAFLAAWMLPAIWAYWTSVD